MKTKFLKNKYIAHRGLHNRNIPENSLLAFKKAIESDYIIEFDVQLTKDNKVVVFHDNNIKRMTKVDRKINNCTYIELQKYNLLNTKEKIPTLESALKLINGQVPILLEFKEGYKRGIIENKVLSILNNYKGDVYFQTFSLKTYFYLRNKGYKNGLLVKRRKKSYYYFMIYILCVIFKVDFISIHYSYLSNKYIEKLYNKIPVLIWTIKNKEKYSDLDIVDGIIFEDSLCD